MAFIRDWGYAEEYVEGMWRALQAEKPDTFVFATGSAESVREFATMAFRGAGIEVAWNGKGPDERAIADRRPVVRIMQRVVRA